MSTADEMPWTEDESMELFFACVRYDPDQIAAWFDRHITTPAREFTVIFSMASWCRILAEKADIITDGDFVMLQALPGASPDGIGIGQMVTAALNHDDDALSGHVDAYMRNADERTRLVTVVQLAQLISFLATRALEATSSKGEPAP